MNAPDAQEKALKLLEELGEILPSALGPRQWYTIAVGFGTDPFIDHREAEAAMRTLYRIIATSTAIP